MLPIRNAKGKFGEGCVLSFGEDGTRMREGYRDYATAIENFEIRDDDIIVATFPKSGTTWTQEMVWLVKNCNNLEGSSADIHQRFPMLEGCTLQFPCKTEHWLRDSIEYLNQIKNQRFIKTHLPCSLLPNDIKYHRKTPKIIYVVRNPKDVCISYYHHFRNIVGFKGGVEDFFELFINDTILYAPYWKHVIGYYNIKHLSNVLIIKYEDMKRDLKAVIIKVQRFLESEPLTDKQLRLISQRCKKKRNPSVDRPFYESRMQRYLQARNVHRPDIEI
ncbi:sulfotransferase 1E1-like isoform X2 [Photinus pyralis]|uniref:Sulfotransferase domain-containing protein n=1 Tax=Photinus pyralis TaxID=7054 RepID=A0A1Y1NGG4_PHOPY|nr:sulfotransferase 1E1-like isoform X2 [Photinus pyralis]